MQSGSAGIMPHGPADTMVHGSPDPIGHGSPDLIGHGSPNPIGYVLPNCMDQAPAGDRPEQSNCIVGIFVNVLILYSCYLLSQIKL